MLQQQPHLHSPCLAVLGDTLKHVSALYSWILTFLHSDSPHSTWKQIENNREGGGKREGRMEERREEGREKGGGEERGRRRREREEGKREGGGEERGTDVQDHVRVVSSTDQTFHVHTAV